MSNQDNSNEAYAEQTPQADMYDPNAVETGGSDLDAEAAVIVEDKKSANRTTVVILGCLLIGAASIYYMRMQAGPTIATANPSAKTAETTIKGFLTDGGKSMRDIEVMLRSTQRVVDQFTQFPNVTLMPLDPEQVDPFDFPRPPKPKVNEQEELRKKQEEQRKAILASAEKLSLQSIVHGSNVRACMINNVLYSEGQAVNDFTIEKISSDNVVVRCGDLRFMLRMKQTR